MSDDEKEVEHKAITKLHATVNLSALCGRIPLPSHNMPRGRKNASALFDMERFMSFTVSLVTCEMVN